MTRSRAALALFLVLCCWVLFFQGLGDRDLWSSHEARAAQNAESILTDGCWSLPQLLDRSRELQKPPLYYWLIAAVSWLRGQPVDAWSVRLPAALAGLGGVILLGWLGVARRRPLAGYLAAAVLATFLHYTWLARTGRIDMPLTLAVSTSLVAFYLGSRRRKEPAAPRDWLFLAVAYTAAALAVLLKGPIGLLLPAAVALAFLAIEGDLPPPWLVRAWLVLLHRLGFWWGVPLLLALSLPWFVWADVQTQGEFSRVFLWKHNLARGLGGDDTLASHPWWYYLPRSAFDLLPWSPLLVILGWRMWRKGTWRVDGEARFGFVWLVTVVGLLSCFRFKRADYLLPAYPGAALFVGCLLERGYHQVGSRRAFAAAFALLITACTGGWWVYLTLMLPSQESSLECRRFAREIRRLSPPPSLVIFFRAEAHALAFHVGRPVGTLVEWENLDYWAARPEQYYVIMPAEEVPEWPAKLRAGRLEEVMRSTDFASGSLHRPWVLLRTLPGAGPVLLGHTVSSRLAANQ